MRLLLWLSLAGAVFAQGTTPKQKPEDYPVHAPARSAALGAEFMVNSFSGGQETYIVKGFLVVEVALFPPQGQMVDAHSGNFVLHVNGKKQELLPQPPSTVCTTISHPEWEDTRHLQVEGAAGPASVGLGQQRARYPGVHHEPTKEEQLLMETALPQGEHRGPVSGFLYFAFSGKTSSIKSLELQYEDAVLKLR